MGGGSDDFSEYTKEGGGPEPLFWGGILGGKNRSLFEVKKV